MLQITVPGRELYDEEKEEFITERDQVLQLEHSLVSLHKWESKWCKAFLGKAEKTDEEMLDYIRCMNMTQNVKPEVYDRISEENIKQVYEYINAPMTATYFSEEPKGKGGQETVTAELIYYWMIALNIPFECRKWHLNSLLTLVRVCNVKNTPPKKRSKREILSRNAELNAARRKQLNTKG